MSEIARFVSRLAGNCKRASAQGYDFTWEHLWDAIYDAWHHAPTCAPAPPEADEDAHGMRTMPANCCAETYERGRAEEREACARLAEEWGYATLSMRIRQRAQGEG